MKGFTESDSGAALATVALGLLAAGFAQPKVRVARMMIAMVR